MIASLNVTTTCFRCGHYFTPQEINQATLETVTLKDGSKFRFCLVCVKEIFAEEVIRHHEWASLE